MGGDSQTGERVMAKSVWFAILMLLVGTCARQTLAEDGVRLLMNGTPATVGEYKCDDIHSLVMDNGLVAITFGKDALGDFSATSLTKNGQELLHNLHGVEPRDIDHARSFYMDYGASTGRLSATRIKIISVSPTLIHFAVIDDGGFTPFGYANKPAPVIIPPTTQSDVPADAPAPVARPRPNRSPRARFALEHHFVMLPTISGIYAYAIVNTPNAGGEMRTMYRFDRSLLDYAWTDERTGQQPTYAALEKMPKLQDETWRLPDGTIYQKYDYCAYLAESPMWGHYGHGFGAFLIPASTEYYAGGPYREELLVHQDALILNYLGGGHFSGGGPATNGKPKMFGPWLIYINAAATPDALINDAKKAAAAEQAKWPYQWVDETLYPLHRTIVTGQLHLTAPGEGQTVANAWVVLAKPEQNVYTQGGDFIFYTKADAQGRFILPHVRAGSYALYAWPREGSITDELEKDGITVQGDSLDLGQVDWTTTHHGHLLWQIGKSDGMAGEFKFGDQPRNIQWIDKVPANLEFTIGTSNPAEDWYFAQGKVGRWDIKFDVQQTTTGTGTLTIALAGGGGGPVMQPLLNGTNIGDPISPRNDSATYRSAVRSGNYTFFQIKFPATLLKQGPNLLRLDMTKTGGHWHGLMYDTLLLEAE
jgi:rhamnogalacturonan endolyase